MASRIILADQDFGGVSKVTGLPAPSNASDAATKAYVDGLAGGSAATFETVSKNLAASGSTLNYTGDELTSITYASGIIKTFAYGVNGLETITLSGATPGGIDLVKTLSYVSGNLTSIAYS